MMCNITKLLLHKLWKYEDFTKLLNHMFFSFLKNNYWIYQQKLIICISEHSYIVVNYLEKQQCWHIIEQISVIWYKIMLAGWNF